MPQFTTQIDGVDIHFIHVKSAHENALPLIMTHGWPGSVIELLETVGPLTDPTAHGGTAEDAFHLVLPSIPGYGFSERAHGDRLGSRPHRAGVGGADAAASATTRYVAQGGDVGASITDAMGRQAPEGLVGIHTNLLVTGLAGGDHPSTTEEEKAALAALATFRASGFGYFLEQATRPQTIGYALLDSPVALAAWMLDHDTDSYYKISHAFVDGEPSGNLTRDHIVDNITLYWLTGTGASAARSYWESGRAQGSRGRQGPSGGLAPGRLHRVPGRDLRGPAQLGRAGVPQLSRTTTRPTGAATSPPGRSRSCSQRSCEPRLARCADKEILMRTSSTANGVAHDTGPGS